MLMLSLYCKAKALLASRDRGASAVEYALLIFAIVGVIAVGVIAFGGAINTKLDQACNKVVAGTC